ncbi:hypothetical protein CA51_15790 [Rosistilla oblonga]|uniref:sigma-70 family RNA polymerase sigma factor n=1 Tax=Rosistilla oblonga TaxID=2527990 RepID=UPI00118A838F|nr:sigma-70 family RNA polymerase sigma factor [Rosistilla oblonga]QDV11704.1 hypothetical protein CA51_15790 [Rosistilla oblonga]
MHRIIRLKAADLGMEWAIDADDVYDEFIVERFALKRPREFQNAYHFTCYVEKCLRRKTSRAAALTRTSNAWIEGFHERLVASVTTEDFIWREELAVARASLTLREDLICLLVQEQLSWHEIGRRLGLAPDTARMIHQRAISRVRSQLFGGA